MPLVSVIIPYFKKKEYIERSINSVLNQTFKDLEIIIIYDDTNLEEYNFLKSHFSSNDKIRIIKNSKNLGAGLSRNEGIKFSKGKLLAFLDADDMWLPDKLDKQIKFMIKNNCQFSFSNYKKKLIKNKTIEVNIPKNILNYKDLINSCEIGLSTVIINKNIVLENLFPNLKTQEDYVAWLKITKKNIQAYNIGESLVVWNETKYSLSSNFFQKIYDAFKVYYIYENFNLIKSLYFLIRLSLNSLKRKII